MEHYQKALGGTLELQTMGEKGTMKPAGPGDNIVYSRLEADGAQIVGVDGHPNYPPTAGDNMAIALSGTDSERLNQIFNVLAEGGKVKMPLSPQPGRGAVGWLTDKFGINWMVSVNGA
jgi:PhnB protein